MRSLCFMATAITRLLFGAVLFAGFFPAFMSAEGKSKKSEEYVKKSSFRLQGIVFQNQFSWCFWVNGKLIGSVQALHEKEGSGSPKVQISDEGKCFLETYGLRFLGITPEYLSRLKKNT